MRAVERLAGRDRHAAWDAPRGLGVGRLEAEAAGHLDRAQQDLQHMQRAAGLEAVGMGRDAAHGVEATGRPIILSCRSPRKSVQGWSSSIGFVEGHAGDSAAMARMRSGGMPQRSATASGA
jgi:hypothetical protein